MFSIIAAGCITSDPMVYGIGYGGHIPWHISDDLRYFKKITAGSTLIMGRITWESIGGPLPGRTHIIITSKPGKSSSVSFTSSLEQALEMAVEPIFIIGGGMIYDAALKYLHKCQAIYLTVIHDQYQCDTYIRIPEFPHSAHMKDSYDSGTNKYVCLEFRKYTL